MKIFISFLFFMLGVTQSYADIYATRQGNVTYYSNSYSQGATQSNGRAGNVNILADASNLKSNVGYPTAAAKIQPNIILGGVMDGDVVSFDQPIKMVSRFAILPGLTPVLMLDGKQQTIPQDGAITLKDLDRGEHVVKAMIIDASGNSFAQSNEIHFTVRQASELNKTDQTNQTADDEEALIDETKVSS